jgi:hypothetical protein
MAFKPALTARLMPNGCCRGVGLSGQGQKHGLAKRRTRPTPVLGRVNSHPRSSRSIEADRQRNPVGCARLFAAQRDSMLAIPHLAGAKDLSVHHVSEALLSRQLDGEGLESAARGRPSAGHTTSARAFTNQGSRALLDSPIAAHSVLGEWLCCNAGAGVMLQCAGPHVIQRRVCRMAIACDSPRERSPMLRYSSSAQKKSVGN